MGVTEKDESEYRHNSIILPLFECWDHQDFDAKIKVRNFADESWVSSRELLIEMLLGEFKSMVAVCEQVYEQVYEHEFESRYQAKLSASSGSLGPLEFRCKRDSDAIGIEWKKFQSSSFHLKLSNRKLSLW